MAGRGGPGELGSEQACDLRDLRVPRNFRLTLPGGRRLACADAASHVLARKHPEVRSAGKGSKGGRW